MDGSPDGLQEVVGEYVSQKISRRELLKRAGVLGLTAAAVGPLVATGAAGATTSRTKAAAANAPKKGGTFREGYDRVFTPPNPVANAWADPDYNALFEALVMRNPQDRKS